MKRLFFLAMGMFTVGCSSFIIAGLIPQIGKTLGESIAVTSQGITSFGLTYLISAPIFSIIFANKSVKLVVQIALIVLVFGNLITLLSDNITLFLAGRALVGIGAGIFTPLCVTIASHMGHLSTKGKRLSLVWGANSAGVVFGVPFGLYLSSLLNWQLSIAYVVILGLFTFLGISLQTINLNLPESLSLKERFRPLGNQKIVFVTSITCLTSMACLGLYSFIAPIQSETLNSLSLTLFAWGLGGFIGSSVVGFFVDRMKNPQVIMVLILIGLILVFITIPFTKYVNLLGLIAFFLWGAFGWATTTPQQHILCGLQKKQGTILIALNASAIGLGSALGTAIGGSMVASGFKTIHLPFLAAMLLSGVLIFQLLVIKH